MTAIYNFRGATPLHDLMTGLQTPFLAASGDHYLESLCFKNLNYALVFKVHKTPCTVDPHFSEPRLSEPQLYEHLDYSKLN